MAKYQNAVHKVLDPGLNFTGVATAAVLGGTFATFAAGGVPGAPNLVTANATDKVVGVFKYDAAAGETVGVLTGGQCDVIAGGAIVAKDPVKSDAAGKAVKATTAAEGFGTAFTDAAAAGRAYIHFG